MRILILTDIAEEDIYFSDKFVNMLDYLQSNNHLINVFHVNQANISNCLACYTCWIKSPGTCRIKDGFRKFTEKFYQSDKLIIFSRILFGCYSNEIKCYLERLLINMLPFFEYRHNRMYHSARYLKIPEYIMVGYNHIILQEEQTIFFNLVKNNAANIKQKKYTAVILTCCSYILKSDRE